MFSSTRPVILCKTCYEFKSAETLPSQVVSSRKTRCHAYQRAIMHCQPVQGTSGSTVHGLPGLGDTRTILQQAIALS
jgi:hypothetical protein